VSAAEAHEYLTISEVARICHVGTQRVRRWIHAGDLPASPPVGGDRGRDRLVRRADLDRVLAPPRKTRRKAAS
jgi:excisionase family DNA binding protein